MNQQSHKFATEPLAPTPRTDVPRGVLIMEREDAARKAISPVQQPTYLKAASWTGELHDVSNTGCDNFITIARHTRGTIVERTDIKAAQAKKGQITVTSGLGSSVWRSHGPLTFQHFYLDRELLSWVAQDIGFDRKPDDDPIEFVGASLPALSLVLDQVSEGLLYGQPDPMITDAWGVVLCDLLLRNSGSAKLAPDANVSCPLSAHRLRSVFDLIEAHLDERITLKRLAQEAGCSEYFFCRAFKSMTGVTPHQYVLDRRVARAREMLEDSNEAIAEIAYAVGFSSQSHMTETFKRRTGVTPGTYRRATMI